MEGEAGGDTGIVGVCIICSKSEGILEESGHNKDKGDLEAGWENRDQREDRSRHYRRFLTEVLRGDRRESRLQGEDVKVLQTLPVCVGCAQVMKNCGEKKGSVQELEGKVIELQAQLGEVVRKREEQLKEYYVEMKRLEEIVRGSEVSKREECLKGKMERNGGPQGKPGNLPEEIRERTGGREVGTRQEEMEGLGHVRNHFALGIILREAIIWVIRELQDKQTQPPDKVENTRRKSKRLKGNGKRRLGSGLVDGTESMLPLLHCAVEMESNHGDGAVSKCLRKKRRKPLGSIPCVSEFSLEKLIKEESLEEPRTTQECGDNPNDETTTSEEGQQSQTGGDDGFEPEVVGEVVLVNGEGILQISPNQFIRRNKDLHRGNQEDDAEEDSQSPEGNPDFEDESMDSSDDDFLLDEGDDDLGSESESSMSSSEDDNDDADGDEYGRKRANRKKKERDPSKKETNPDSKRSRKASYTRALDRVNFSRMSKLRRKLVQRVFHKKYRRPQRRPKNPGKEEVEDPRLEHFIEYDPLLDTFSLGGIRILVHEEQDEEEGDILSLECSTCGWQAKPTQNSRHPVDSFMYNHIAGQHLHLFQCFCGSNLGGYKQYSDHVLGHRMGFACDVCGRPLGGSQALARHKWSHLNDLEAAELVAKGLKDPREKKESTKIYPCTTCGKIFPQRCQLKKHEKVHAEVRERITCEICGKLFLPSGFISHKRYYCFPAGVEHPRISCPLCPKVFKNKQFMQVHMDRAHNSERNHKCPQCGKGFKTKKDLMTHEETHTTERAFSCKKGCGRTYKTRKNCNAHEKRCDGRGGVLIQRFLDAGQERPFSCRKGCGRAYKTRRTLRGHEKNCSGAPFVAELGGSGLGMGESGGDGPTTTVQVTTMTAFGAALQASMEAVMEGAAGIPGVVVAEEIVVPEAVATETVVTKMEYS